MFEKAGLPFIPPELRENRGEIEAARAGMLPTLVETGDLRGDLHAHSRASDGHESIEVMAHAAKERGLQYLAITDHSKRLTVAHGLDSKRVLAQIEKKFILNALVRNQWNVTQAAKMVGLQRTNFQNMMRKYGIQRPTG